MLLCSLGGIDGIRPPRSTGWQGCVALLGCGEHLLVQVGHQSVKYVAADLLVGSGSTL